MVVFFGHQYFLPFDRFRLLRRFEVDAFRSAAALVLYVRLSHFPDTYDLTRHRLPFFLTGIIHHLFHLVVLHRMQHKE